MKIEKITPAYKDYIWGGNKLKEKYGKKTDLTPCAESWELSFHRDGVSSLSSGEPITSLPSEAFGKNVSDFSDFPLLIKFN